MNNILVKVEALESDNREALRKNVTAYTLTRGELLRELGAFLQIVLRPAAEGVAEKRGVEGVAGTAEEAFMPSITPPVSTVVLPPS